MRCKDDHSPKEWDVLLAEMGGHPLQSALWGEAKKTVYGKDRRGRSREIVPSRA